VGGFNLKKGGAAHEIETDRCRQKIHVGLKGGGKGGKKIFRPQGERKKKGSSAKRRSARGERSREFQGYEGKLLLLSQYLTEEGQEDVRTIRSGEGLVHSSNSMRVG